MREKSVDENQNNFRSLFCLRHTVLLKIFCFDSHSTLCFFVSQLKIQARQNDYFDFCGSFCQTPHGCVLVSLNHSSLGLGCLSYLTCFSAVLYRDLHFGWIGLEKNPHSYKYFDLLPGYRNLFLDQMMLWQLSLQYDTVARIISSFNL